MKRCVNAKLFGCKMNLFINFYEYRYRLTLTFSNVAGSTHARTQAVSFMRAHARTPSQFIFMMYRALMTQRLAMLVSNQPGEKARKKGQDRSNRQKSGRREWEEKETERERERRRGCERDEGKHPRNVKRSDCLSLCGLLPLPFDLIAKERKIHDRQYTFDMLKGYDRTKLYLP